MSELELIGTLLLTVDSGCLNPSEKGKDLALGFSTQARDHGEHERE